MTTTPSLAVEPKAISITQYEALTSDIEIAKQSAVESFDYEDPKGDKAARSYIASLRKIRSRIESARKEAKSYALEYGRAVDAQAKALESEILGLIEPHQKALDEIAQREKDRVAKHEEALRIITELVQQGMSYDNPAPFIRDCIARLKACPTGEMEEFQEAADTEIANGLRLLEALCSAAEEREQREALEAAEAHKRELEEQARLKAEQEARQAEAVERARQEGAAEAARAVAAAEQQARESDARAAAAETQRLGQEKAIAEALRVGEEKKKERERLQREAEEAARNAKEQRSEELVLEVAKAMAGKHRLEVANAIVDGTLHPAVIIDWGKVQ